VVFPLKKNTIPHFLNRPYINSYNSSECVKMSYFLYVWAESGIPQYLHAVVCVILCPDCVNAPFLSATVWFGKGRHKVELGSNKFSVDLSTEIKN
jgi:hypothetical protein